MRRRREKGRLLAVEELAEGIRLAVVGSDEVEARVLVPLEGGLESTLRAALSRVREAGHSLPRRALLLTDRVAAVCLDLPPLAQAGQAQIEGLVRFEIEPHLVEGGRELACGWAKPRREQTQPGPVLTCGLAESERARLCGVFRGAGLELLALYPRLGCGTALVPELPAEATLLEASGNQLSVARWEQGGVSRLRVLSGLSPRDAAQSASSLISSPLVAIGLLDEEVEANLRANHPDLIRVAASQPSGVLGAARHLRAELGGDRVAGVSAARQGTPLLERPLVKVLAAFVLVLLTLGAVDYGLHSWRAEARREFERREAAEEQLKLRDRVRQALETKRDQLLATLGPARANKTSREEAEQRTRELTRLLAVLAKAPAGVALDRCHDGPEGVEVAGIADSGQDAERFLTRLELSLKTRGLHLAEREVKRTAEGFRFSAAFAEPTPKPRGRVK